MSRLAAAKVSFTTGPAGPTAAVSGIGFRPRAAVAWWSCQPGHGSHSGNRGGIGFWTPDRAVAVAWRSDDGRTAIATQHEGADVALLGLGASSEERGMRADVDFSDAEDIAVRWTETPSETWTVHVLAFGDPVAAEAGWTTSLESVASTSASDLLLAVPAPREGSAAAGLVVGIGATGRDGRASAGYSPRRGARPGTVVAAQRLGAATVELEEPSSRMPARPHAYLALRGIHATISADVSKTGPGRRRSRTGFRPDALLLFSWGLAASRDQRRIGRLCLGGAAVGASGCTSWDDCNVETPETRTHVHSSDEHALLVADTQTGRAHAAAGVALDERGFTMDWHLSDGHRRQFVYVALGAPPAAASSFKTRAMRSLRGRASR